MNTERKTRIITRPNEVRAKIVPSDYNKAGIKRITIYIGKDIYNDFFTKQERKGDTRVKLDLKEDGKLILRKTRYPEGAKLCLQGRGIYGTHKILTTLPSKVDALTLPSSNHALNFNFIKEFGVKSLELMPQSVNKKAIENNMITNKKSLAPKGYEIRLKVNTYNKTFRIYFTKLFYDKFIVRDNDIGRIEFFFPTSPFAKYFFLRRVSDSKYSGKLLPKLGHKIVKNSHSKSYTVMGKIPECFDASFINPENHVVNYQGSEEVIKIYPQLVQNRYATNNTGKGNYDESDELSMISQQDEKGNIYVKDGKDNLIPITAPTNTKELTKKQIDDSNKQIEEYNIMAKFNKNQEARINELEKNQEEIFTGLIEKFNNTTQEVLKSVLENELADIRNTISAKNNDIDEKLIAKANDMFQGILDNILQKELEVIKEQIKGNEKDIKDILKELVKISYREKQSWFSRIFG
jgi:hypothetical protein